MSQEKIRVILVDDIAELRRNMEKLLLLEEDIQVVGSAGTGEEGIELAKRVHPDVVIMDINMPGIDGISAAEILTREVPGIQIIMMSVQGEADYMRRSMLAGAREFLIKPSTTEEIVTSIRRVYKLAKVQRAHLASVAPASEVKTDTESPVGSKQTGPKSAQPGYVIAVFGAKGGVGASSTATNLAIALRQLAPSSPVAVMDGNTEFGDLNVHLNLASERSIVDLLALEELDPHYVDTVFIEHESGIKVMPGSSPEEAELVKSELVERTIKLMRDHFGYIVFDTRTTFSEPILTILDQADAIVLVATAEIPAVRNARLFIEVAERLGYPKDKIKLVLNKYDPQGYISAQAIETSVKHPVTTELPRDDRLANTAIQQGRPATLINPRSSLALAYRSLASSVSGIKDQQGRAAQKANQGVAETPVKRPSLLARFFGR